MTARALRYVAFAVIATLMNLGVQRVVLGAGEGAWFFALAVGAGTLAGLVIKYFLDKRWIFDDRAPAARQFTLYTVMGMVTTGIFWGFETAFWLIWSTDAMRELGAVIGLVIGYGVKYALDWRYVFTDAAA